ncbi:MAG: MerC domain-containing protein [Pseudomonadota bacterium]
MSQFSKMDATALTLSGLCLLHCLALPVLASTLPLFGVMAEAEWLHRAFVLAAVPITGFAIMQPWRGADYIAFCILALTGISLLVAGAFVEPLEAHETLLTVCGALLVAAAHALRWQRQVS